MVYNPFADITDLSSFV